MEGTNGRKTERKGGREERKGAKKVRKGREERKGKKNMEGNSFKSYFLCFEL